MSLILLGVFIILLIIGVPIGFSLGLAAIAGLIIRTEVPLTIIVQRFISGINSFPLMAIPFFILAGNLMTAAGITSRILAFSSALVGRFRGGLAMVNIVASMFFGGISGSAVADTSAIGGVLIPSMISKGYQRDYSVAVTASSSCLAPIIPPSITMIIYGTITGVSITRLFLAGMIPGLLYGFGLMIVAYIYAIKRNYAREKPVSLKEFISIFKDAIWAMLMPIIILGGILLGVFTPTEAGAVAVVYALFVGIFIYKELKLKVFLDVIKESGIRVGIIMLVIGMASAFTWLLAVRNVPMEIGDFLISLTSNKWILLFFINITMLIVGIFISANPALIIFVPILYPLAMRLGVDPIHFGIIIVFNLCLGLLTPPVGMCLIIAAEIANISLGKASVATLMFFLVGILVLLLITYVPAVVTYLPSMLMP